MSRQAATPSLPVWRLALARILVVLGVLLTAAALLSGYLRWQAFDRDTFRDTSSELIADDAVREQVAATLVERLFANVDVAASLEARLPAGQRGLAEPLAGALRALADEGSVRLLERPRTQALWRTSVAAAHDRLVALLRDETTVVQVRDRSVVIDLRPLIVQLGERIGLAGNLETRLPRTAGLITIMDAQELERAQDVTSLFETVARWIWVAPLAFFAAAVWLTHGRRRFELRAVALGIVLAGLLVLVLRALAGGYVVDELATTTGVRDAAEAAWAITTDLLADGAWTAVGVGVVTLVGVWLAGATVSGTGVRRWLAPMLARPDLTYGVVAGLVLLAVWWGPTAQTRRPLFLLAAAVFLVAGVEVLRRLVAREHPNAGAISPRELLRLRSRPADSRVEELERLHAQGVLNDDELAAAKARLAP